MSARAQDVTSKLLLDGRPANTVNLPTRPPLACLPVSLLACRLACRFACLLCLCFACLPVCLLRKQFFAHPTLSFVHLRRRLYTDLFLLLSSLFCLSLFSSLHFYLDFFVVVPVVLSYYVRITVVIGVGKSYWQISKEKNAFP